MPNEGFGKRRLVLLCAVAMAVVLSGSISLGVFADPPGHAIMPMTVDLIADQDIDAGDIVIWNDADNLYVKYTVISPWTMTATQLQISDSVDEVPQANGNPIPGQFMLVDLHYPAVTEWQYVVPLTVKAKTSLVIAAHASLMQMSSSTIVSAPGDTVYGPLYVDTPVGDASWGEPKAAVQARNWLGNANNPILPGVYLGSPMYWWGTPILTATDVPGATWISTAENTEVWWNSSWRWFTKEFVVPSDFVSGSMSINVDDNYSVYLNGALVGSDGYLFGPPLDPGTGVETYSLDLVAGVNKLDVIAKNSAYPYNGEELLGQLHNPTGLTYKITIDSVLTESAWSAGMAFPGTNWATYTLYTVEK